MPRRDEFPTNAEMLRQFTGIARDTLVRTYERDFSHGLGPALRGKPLWSLELKVLQPHMNEDSPVLLEQVNIGILAVSTARLLSELPLFRQASSEELTRYQLAAEKAGGVILDDATELDTALAPEGVNASYQLTYVNRRVSRASSYNERSTKAAIAGAKYFLGEVQTYIESDLFRLSPEVRLKRILAQHALRESAAENEVPLMSHTYSFVQVPELPLNGHEPRVFLEQYADKMATQALQAARHLKRQQALGAKPALLALYRQQYERYDRAYRRADDMLRRHSS